MIYLPLSTIPTTPDNLQFTCEEHERKINFNSFMWEANFGIG